MNKTRFSQIIALTSLVGLLLAGFLAPTIYATADSTSSPQADGSFPVFPTVIEDGVTKTVVSPTAPTPEEKTTITETETISSQSESLRKAENVEAFSLWRALKQAIFGNARAGEEGVVFALAALDAKPGNRGDLRYQISYVNNTTDTLRDVSIQVLLPKELRYLDSDLKPNSKGTGAVMYEIGKIAAGEEGAIQLETRLRKAKAKDVVLSATMTYEDIDGGEHAVTATANNAFSGKNSGLTASVLGGVGGVILRLFIITLIVALRSEEHTS